MYRDILKKNLRSSARKTGLKRGWMILQDNDPKHNSQIVQSESAKMKIKYIKNTAQSPDVNPKETLWDHVGCKVLTQHKSSIKTNEDCYLSLME